MREQTVLMYCFLDDRGRSASKRQWFYGFKVQVLATSDGVPVNFYVHAGREADITGLRAMAVDLPAS